MWLLSTDRAELRFFSDPNKVPGGYAILSHTWQAEEQAFQDLRAIQEQCKTNGQNPLNHVCEKIKRCCGIARRDGYRWVWIDTCCIDKTSSTELSEAINSMWRWYVCAEVCYAYLSDVPSDCELDKPNSAFRKARWHTRGWTLQELLAPALVVFLSKDWKTIGTKHELASLLNNITAIRVQVLQRAKSIFFISVAERMSWAAKRSTTRIEDEAYSLLGIFGITMPTLYGEGDQAFRRLQLEIARQSQDASLFAWGVVYWVAEGETREPIEIEKVWSNFHGSSYDECYLLAKSPSNFAGRSIHFTPALTDPKFPYLAWQWKQRMPDEPEHSQRKRLGPFGKVQLPTWEMTSYGMKCHFPIADLENSYSIAVLLCETQGKYVGLLLHEAQDNASELQDPTRKKYYTAYAFMRSTIGRPQSCRLVYLGGDLHNLEFRGKHLCAEWRDIYIIDRPPHWYDSNPALRLVSFRLDSVPGIPFRIPRWSLGVLQSANFLPNFRFFRTAKQGQLQSTSISFLNSRECESVIVCVGLCAAKDAESESGPVHWATSWVSYDKNWTQPFRDYQHNCPEDHVDQWGSERTRDFVDGEGDSERRIRLLLRPCAHNPKTTLVVFMELVGPVYEKIQNKLGVRLPSLKEMLPPDEPEETPTTQSEPDGTPSAITAIAGVPHVDTAVADAPIASTVVVASPLRVVALPGSLDTVPAAKP